MRTADTTLPNLKPSAQIARSADSSDLVNFPFAFSAFVQLAIGLVMMAWGCFLASPSVTVPGFFLALVGGSFFGCSLFEGRS